MSEKSRDLLPNIFPFMRYQDAPAAIEWLAKAFGFEKQMVAPGANGTIAHAQLSIGPGVIMLGTAREDDLRMKSPRDLPGVNQGVYIYVTDVDAHYQRANDAGAEIVRQLKDTDYGSREYTARDPEGHLWSFGTYRPDAASGRGSAMKHFALLYYVVDDYVSRRAAYREAHLRLAGEAYRRGELLLAGAFSDPADRALLVFRASDRSVVEDFARHDPYVTNGLVTRWEVRSWTVVVGNEPSDAHPAEGVR